jgi:hypothetical protein
MVTLGTEIGRYPRGKDVSSKSITAPEQILKVSRSAGIIWPCLKDVASDVRSNNRWLKEE